MRNAMLTAPSLFVVCRSLQAAPITALLADPVALARRFCIAVGGVAKGLAVLAMPRGASSSVSHVLDARAFLCVFVPALGMQRCALQLSTFPLHS